MNKRKISTKEITLMGILMALQIIVTRFIAIETPFVRISFLFIPTAMMAMVFSPMLTGVGTVLSDFIGIMLFPKGFPYFPGFSLSAFLTGFLYSVFFYKKEMTWKRVIIANVLVSVVIDIFLNTLWVYQMQGVAAIAQIPVRVTKTLVLLPLHIVLMYALGNKGILKNQIIKFQ